MTFEMKLQEKYEEGYKEGYKEGFKEGLEESLEVLVFSLRSLVDDFDKVYDQIRRNEVYANVTPEMVRKFYK